MNEGAFNLVDHVLPAVPLRQFVVTMPFPLRFPLTFDGKLLGHVVRIFTDTVAGWYRRRQLDCGLPPGETGAVTVIQIADSNLRLNPHLHTIFLDGLYSPDGDGKGLRPSCSMKSVSRCETIASAGHDTWEVLAAISWSGQLST
jgi:hypothetical protein